MQTEISPYGAMRHRDVLTRLALQRANIMHLVDLKRGGYSPRRTEMRIGRRVRASVETIGAAGVRQIVKLKEPSL